MSQAPPTMGYQPPPPQNVPNYLVQAILVTLFCCLPFGIVSIVFAAQVNGKLAAGDYNGALEASRKAKQFAMWGFIVGLVVIGAMVLLQIVAIVGAAAAS